VFGALALKQANANNRKSQPGLALPAAQNNRLELFSRNHIELGLPN
jgi:hypothetical protein